MIKVTLDSLQEYLRKKKHDVQLQKETQQLYIILKIEGKEFPLFLRIFEQSELLQLLVFMPTPIKPGTHADVARLLHLLNKELDIPGFGMDENTHLAFYRCMLPIPGKKIDETLFDAYFKSIELICESITAPVFAVASGLATYQEILQKAKESVEKNKFKP